MALLICAPICANADSDQAPLVVVNQSNPQESISLGSLRTVFGMRLRTWPNGTPIKVVVLPDNKKLHIEFCKKVLGIFPHQLRWAWDRLVYSGTGQAPQQVSTEEQMLEALESTPGAIGYLSQVPDGAKVKSIRIR
ncbi:MAG: hypothetical protein GC138_07635 [Gammaproteobacteria bacterium]|nr:hypothetical protein [Gammaproteobacteria bacterium]